MLLDETALLACMTYVDLNPIRAGTALDLMSSMHTAVQRRLRQPPAVSMDLGPIAGCSTGEPSLIHDQYVALVDWTGRWLHPGKRGRITGELPAWFGSRGVDAEAWSMQVLSIETRYWRAVGSARALMEKARAIGKRWLKGVGRKAASRLSAAA